MGLMFASFIFLMFDINVTLYEIDILPDFLGWVFILLATFKMSDLIKCATLAKAVQIVMLVLSLPYEVSAFLPAAVGSVFSFAYGVLKLLTMTVVLFCFSNIKDQLTDKTYYYTAKKIWLIFLTLEAVYFIYAGLIEHMLPESASVAITQAIVMMLLFAQVLFLIFLRKIQNKVDLK